MSYTTEKVTKVPADIVLEKILILTSKGSVERAKTRYERHCTIKTIWPHYFTPTDIEFFREDYKLSGCTLLPDVTEEGCRVGYFRLNSEKALTTERLIRYIKFLVLICEYCFARDYPNGYIIIMDLRHMNLLTLLTFATRHLSIVQQSTSIMMEAYGMRIKGLHIVTPSKAVDTLINFIKPLHSEKVGSRFQAHKDMDTVFAHVPKKIIPCDMGGEAPPLPELQEKFIQALYTKEHQEWMKEAKESTIDPSKKPNDCLENDFVGMAGTFRTLSVD